LARWLRPIIRREIRGTFNTTPPEVKYKTVELFLVLPVGH
jgi:hypothetical protein